MRFRGEQGEHSPSFTLDQLILAQVRSLRRLHGELVTLELAQMGVPALTGAERKAMIDELGEQARRDVLPVQLAACKMILNYLCPGWETVDIELAQIFEERIPADLAWVDIPARKASCH